jgi:PAS domain S-box-containing protein
MTTQKIVKSNQDEKKFQMLLESVPDSLVFVNRDGRIVMVNEQTEKLFGYPRDEILGQEVEILIPERFRDSHHKFVADYFLNPRPRTLGVGSDLYGMTRDGREFPVDISLSPIESDEGTFVIADIRDISERKQAEDKIKKSYYFQSTISSILQISLEPVSLEEQLGRILDATLSIPWLTPLSMGCIYLVEDDPKMLVMKAQRGLPEPMQSACAKVPFGKCLCGLGASTRKIVFADCIDERHEKRYKDNFPHGHYCVPILSGDNLLGAINLFVSDGHKHNHEEELLSSVANTIAGIITNKRTELEKEKLQEQLIQSETLSALGRVTANVAHDIRNPLTVIGGYVRRLHKTIHDGTKEKEYAEMIITEVDRLEKILRNVLTYSRRTSPVKERHDINEIIDESLRLFELLCRDQSIKIEKFFADLPPITINSEQATEVIDNIISNAIEAMPEGGILTITTGKEDINETDYLKIGIADTGGGIPEDNLRIIFEPFYSTRVAGHGAGLGLSICKKIMEDHGGFVRAESVAGKGSTFSLYFPFSIL